MIKDSNITINVKDIDQSISFYESIGMTLKNRWDNHYAQLVAPGITIGLHPGDANNLKDNSGNLSIGFTTADFEKAKLSLGEKAIVHSFREEEGGKFLHFSDPDGTALYFIQPRW